MDFLVFEKYKDHLIAFLAGAIFSGIGVWSVAENLNKKELAILERGQAEMQKRLSESDTLLKAAQQVSASVSASESKSLSSSRKQEVEAIIQNLDVEIAAKKKELVRRAGMSDQPKDDFYMSVKDELHLLQQQRDSARNLLIMGR